MNENEDTRSLDCVQNVVFYLKCQFKIPHKGELKGKVLRAQLITLQEQLKQHLQSKKLFFYILP